MTLLTLQNGDVYDSDTGAISRPEGASTTARARTPGVREQVVPEGDRLSGLVKNFSWGFNSALFALPDAATRGIGRAIGLKDEDVFTLGKFFNQGAVPARDATERYARAVGEGVGGTMPFTGILAWAARTAPMAKVAPKATTGVLRRVADDAIQFVQRNPRTAAAIDIAFGAGYETLRQAVTENVSDENPNKALYENLLPAAAFIGVPTALNFMPSVIAGKKVSEVAKNKIKSASSGLGDVEDDVFAEIPQLWKLPVINIFPKFLLKNAEKKLINVFGPIEKSPEAQQALKELELMMQDPRFANAGFINSKGESTFDVSEQTMFGPLLARKVEFLNQLGPNELESVKARINQNQQAFDALFTNIAPEARVPMMEAFQAAQADRQALFDGLMKAQKDLTDAEVMAISERLGPQNMEMINNELRGSLMGAMEFDYNMRKNVLSRMGLRQATTPDGLPMPTRENGKSLFPSQDMETAASALVNKYTPERPSLRNPIPEPIAALSNFVRGQQLSKDKIENQMIRQMTDDTLESQVMGSGLGSMLRNSNEEVRESAKKAIDSVTYLFNLFVKQSAGKKLTKGELAVLNQEKRAGSKISDNGEISFKVGVDTFRINPKQIVDDARLVAKEQTAVDINLPEALDYLAAAARFRNDSLARYNAAMSRGGTRLTDAQRLMDTGNAVYKDIEKLILDHVPKISQEYDGMKNVLSDYRAGFEQSLPLLMTQRVGRGDAYLLGNEQLLQRAFQNAGNLRQLQVTMGGNPMFDSLLEKGAIDWLRSKGVVNQDGLVDPKKIRSVIDRNRNIVEALPENIQQKLTDEVALADDYVKRMGELDQRMVLAKNDELNAILRKVSRPDADPRQTLATAIKDPAVMRTLVDELGKDPDRLAALRRAVFDIAGEGTLKGGALKSFIDTNEKSLKVLYGGTGHLDDLKKLADLQRRVNAFADVTGQIPVFQSLDQTMKKLFGAGIQFLTTTAREAAVGRIAPETGALALLVRAGSALENELYQRLFTKALEDPTFAKNLTSLSTPQQAVKLTAQMENIGIPRTRLLRAKIAGAEELTQAALPEEPLPGASAPVVSRETAASMLRALPPAPPTTGYQLRLPTAPPAQSAPNQYANVPMMYPALFPNDPISGLLEQRRQQIQQGQPIQPQVPQ
jgi:hypothetical protein